MSKLVRACLARQVREQIDVGAAQDASALNALGHDVPLLTDAPLLGRALGWLRQVPDWDARLDAVFGVLRW